MLKLPLRIIPATHWLVGYRRTDFSSDLIAALIVTLLLIPQSLAYAMLAGLPPEVGLYASILPLAGYALFGSSRTLSVGPVAIVSLMTASAIGSVAPQGSGDYLTAASTLALLTGLILLAMGLLKLGFITHFLSHGVISGFISASGILIAIDQLPHILGVTATGTTVLEILPSLIAGASSPHLPTLATGASVLVFLVLARSRLSHWLCTMGMTRHHAELVTKASPVFALAVTMLAAWLLGLEEAGVSLTGRVPAGLPEPRLFMPAWDLVRQLAPSALLIALIGYVESVSVGKTLGGRRRQRIDPDQELIGLGAANLASSVSGGLPVAGGFSRSVVNFDAGAVTQMASIITALGIALASLLLPAALHYLPKSALAALIIAAIVPLIDFDILRRTWRFARADSIAIAATIAVTLLLGVETGLGCGMLVSVALHLHRTSKPHIAEVGLLPGTEHFRNVTRYNTLTSPRVLSLRPDESLFFTNTAFLEEHIRHLIYEREGIAHVVLLCSAVNEIDFSALEMLDGINEQLREQGIQLHLSEVKGPVMDKLQHTGLLERLSGNVYLSHFDAFTQLR